MHRHIYIRQLGSAERYLLKCVHSHTVVICLIQNYMWVNRLHLHLLYIQYHYLSYFATNEHLCLLYSMLYVAKGVCLLNNLHCTFTSLIALLTIMSDIVLCYVNEWMMYKRRKERKRGQLKSVLLNVVLQWCLLHHNRKLDRSLFCLRRGNKRPN